MLDDFGRILHQYEEIFRRFTDLFRCLFFYRIQRLSTFGRTTPTNNKKGFVAVPAAFTGGLSAHGRVRSRPVSWGLPFLQPRERRPRAHGPRPTTPTNNKNVPSLIRPGGMRACAFRRPPARGVPGVLDFRTRFLSDFARPQISKPLNSRL